MQNFTIWMTELVIIILLIQLLILYIDLIFTRIRLQKQYNRIIIKEEEKNDVFKKIKTNKVLDNVVKNIK